MKRYAVFCGLLAVAVIPGALPITAGVLLARAVRRVRARRQVKRIVIAYGQRADRWGQA